MKLKTQILLAVLVIFLTVGCVSAADDDAISLTSAPDDTTSIGLPAPTYYNVTEDTYSDYFDENGTFTVTPSAGENSVVRIGNLTGKNFVFNTPNLIISSLDDESVITDGGITLNAGAEGSTILNLVINRNGYDVIAIDNYASNVSIFENIIRMSGEALYNFAAIVVHDSDNVKIVDNEIYINATGQYAYGIDLYTNYVENATISKALISDNIIVGTGEYYIAGISAMNGVTDSEITDNTIILESENLTYGIATAKNYANTEKSGNLLIDNNTIDIESDMAYGIESASQIDLAINNNDITVTGNGAEGIAAYDLEDSYITNNVLNINGGTLTNSYWDTVPNDNIAIFLAGDESNNVIESNVITGLNVDGISVKGSNNNISKNKITLDSDDDIQVSAYGSSMVMGIEAPGSENSITQNDITVEGNATYNYGIDAYAPVYGETIDEVVIYRNNVSVSSDSNYGAGIYASGLSDSSIISENEIGVSSEGMGYGIALDGPSDDTVIIYNDINLVASNARGIEVTNADDIQIIDNDIRVVGDAVYGIAGYSLDDSGIDENQIEVVSGDLSEAYIGWDYIPAGQAPIILLNSTDDTITDNVMVNEFGIETPGSENITTEDNINFMEDELNVEPTVVVQGSGDNFTGYLLDAKGNPIIGQHLYVNLTRTSSGASKVYEVVSDYNGEFYLPINLAVGDYTAQVSYGGIILDDITYDDAEAGPVAIKVVSEMDNRTITVLDADELIKTYGSDDNFEGTLSTFSGFAIPGQHITVELTRTSSGATKAYDVVTDYMGTFTLPINLAVGSYSAAVSFAGTDVYAPTVTSIVPIEVIP